MKVLKLHWLCTGTPSFSVLPSINLLYSRCYLGHNNYLQLLSRFAQYRIMFSSIAALYLGVAISTENRRFETKNWFKIWQGQSWNSFSLASHLPFTIFFKYEQNADLPSGSWLHPRVNRDSDYKVSLNILTDAIWKFNWIGQSQHINKLIALQLTVRSSTKG